MTDLATTYRVAGDLLADLESAGITVTIVQARRHGCIDIHVDTVEDRLRAAQLLGLGDGCEPFGDAGRRIVTHSGNVVHAEGEFDVAVTGAAFDRSMVTA